MVRATSESFETEFVCIPRPIERSACAGRRPAQLSRQISDGPLEKGEAPSSRCRFSKAIPSFRCET